MASRNHTFDIIRGYLLLVIIVDHLYLFPNVFQFATGRGALWVSAAEGFFFISGLMIGLLRGGQIAKRGFGYVTKKISRRAVQLYVVAIAMTLLLTFIGHTLLAQGLTNYKSGISLADWSSIITQTLSFRYMYGWADFLYYYAAYLVLAIPILWLLYKKNRWLEVLILSFGLYFTARSLFGWQAASWMIWQLYFFGGVVMGYKSPVLASWYATFSERTRRKFENSVLAGAALLIALSSVMTFWAKNALVEHWLQWGRAGALRPIIFAIIFGALYIMVDRYGQRLGDFSKALSLLGRHSLYVYSSQAIIVYLAAYLYFTKSWWDNSMVTAIAIGILWMLVKLIEPIYAKPQPQGAFESAQLNDI